MNPPTAAGGTPASRPVRLFLVEDHPLLSDLMVEAVSKTGEFVVVGTAGTAEEALERLQTTPADLLLLDLVLPGMSGMELLAKLQDGPRGLRIVVFSGVGTETSISAAFMLGACAYIEKNVGLGDLLEALRAVMRGQVPLNHRTSQVLRAMVRLRSIRKDIVPTDLEVLRLVAARHTAKEIASELSMSLSGVYKARARIAARLDLKSETSFETAAASFGLVVPGLEPAGLRFRPDARSGISLT